MRPNILLLAIRAYQRFPLVNYAVRLAVSIHHLIRAPQTRPCPYARCSEHFASQAKLHGLAVLPSILAAMAVCGPSTGTDPGCTKGCDGISIDKRDCGEVSYGECRQSG